MNIQEIFLILGSIFFGLFILLFLLAIIVILQVRSAFLRLEKLGQEIGEEVLDVARKTRKYAEYFSGFGISALVGKLFKAGVKARTQRGRHGKSEEDEDSNEE
jgi:hypothetical protein